MAKPAFVAGAVAVALLFAAVATAKPVVIDGQRYLYENARVPADQATPLDEYVAADDSVYTWYDTGYTNITGGGWKGHLINLTSCKWLTEAEVGDRTVWTHQLVIIVPDTIKDPDHGFVWITGGENGNPSPPKVLSEDVILAASLATGAGVVSASLFQIPNQPIYYADDPLKKRRIEDAMIAFGWKKQIDAINAGEAGNPQWLARLPMTKSVVRAMDTVTAFAANSTLYHDAVARGVAAGHFSAERVAAATGTGPSKFVIAGASKRGWTTWTTAAVDKRVVAQIPMVMDALHVSHFMHRMWMSYGGWSFALEDYYALNITVDFDTKGVTYLESVVDPASYIDRYTMPKLVVDATGDEFFMMDDDKPYWAVLPEPKKRLMVQNAEHSLATGLFEVLDSVVAFVAGVITDQKMPELHWVVSPDGSNITMTTDTTPTSVHMWVANTSAGHHTPGTRDFRLLTAQDPCKSIPVAGHCLNLYFFEKTSLSPTSGNSMEYVAKVPIPGEGEGWTAFLIEATYKSPFATDSTYTFTTQASMVPLTLPFPDCTGEACLGTLV